MKRLFIKSVALATIALGAWGCGDKFFDTKYYGGIDVDTGLTSVGNIETALNGIYYRVIEPGFVGRNAIAFGDVATDMTYRNGSTGHWDGIYQYTYVDTDTYIDDTWEWGTKIIDNAARIIQAAPLLFEGATADERTRLDLALAEAYALRGYARLVLVNIYAHQIKVNGTDFSSKPGLVVSEEPIPAFTQVTRATVGETYSAIVSDFTNSLESFSDAGEDRGSQHVYFNAAAANGLLARTHLYMENWASAAASAQAALTASGITELAYTADTYKALFNTESSNTESMFQIAISAENSWGGNSLGTLWESYGMNPSQKLLDLYGENDCRTAVFTYTGNSSESVPEFGGGKLAHFSSGDPSRGASSIVGAPEMYLIIAEANAELGSVDAAAAALLTVAKRDADITAVGDLPGDAAGILDFIKDERARELFQEGLRLWDLRRWDEGAEVYAFGAPNQSYTYTDYKISDLVYPIPAAEINTGYGVAQNEGWDSTRPQ